MGDHRDSKGKGKGRPYFRRNVGGVLSLSLSLSLLFSSLRGRQLLNCLALRPPIGPNERFMRCP